NARIKNLADTDQEFYVAAWDRAAESDSALPPLPLNSKAFLSLGELAQTHFSDWWEVRDFQTVDEGFHESEEAEDNVHQPLGEPLPPFRGTAEGGFEFIAERIAAS